MPLQVAQTVCPQQHQQQSTKNVTRYLILCYNNNHNYVLKLIDDHLLLLQCHDVTLLLLQEEAAVCETLSAVHVLEDDALVNNVFSPRLKDLLHKVKYKEATAMMRHLDNDSHARG